MRGDGLRRGLRCIGKGEAGEGYGRGPGSGREQKIATIHSVGQWNIPAAEMQELRAWANF